MHGKPQKSLISSQRLLRFSFVDKKLHSRSKKKSAYCSVSINYINFPDTLKDIISNSNSTSTNGIVVMMTSTINIIYLGIDIVQVYHDIFYTLKYIFIYTVLRYP